MSKYETLVGQVAEGYQKTFILAAIVSFLITTYHSGFLVACLLLPILGVLYFVGLWLVGTLMSYFVDPAEIRQDIQSRRIATLNRRLEAGELEADSQELEDEMVKAGLEPLGVVVGKGPVFGKHFGEDLYEWIEARKGRQGTVNRYLYVGQAQFDNDGTVHVSDRKPNSDYIVLDGVLYEYVVE